MTSPVRSARAAFALLTRIPVGGFPYAPAEWAWAPAHFPLAGFVVGVALAAAHRVLWPLGSLADAAFVVAASMWTTGAIHEDGLADTADALGGALDRDRVLAILKDSRVGAFGACALVVSIVARIALLDRLGPSAGWALALVGGAARVGPVWQLAVLPYVAQTSSKSVPFAAARVPQALVATAWAAGGAAVAVFLGVAGCGRMIAMAAVLGIVTAVASATFVRRVGGITGDFLGATEQLGEVAAYAVLAWRAA